jgi:hypothetical protein
MCRWLAGTPRPSDYDGCEPVTASVPRGRGGSVHPAMFVPVVVALVVVAMSSARAVTFPSVSAMVAVVAVVGVIVLGVGIGVLAHLPATSPTLSPSLSWLAVPLLSAIESHSIAVTTLIEYAAFYGHHIAFDEAAVLLPRPSYFVPMSRSFAAVFGASLVADIVNERALAEGISARVTGSQVQRVVARELVA